MHISHQAKHPTLHLRRALALAVAGATLALGLLNPLAASAQAPTAKYRITLDNILVNNQTWDDFFQGDGCGDEVLFSTIVQQFDTSGATIYESHPETRQFGDQNGYPERIRAGNCGDYGGIKSLNTVPLNQSVFEGTMTQGQDVLEITPTAIEWDVGASPLGDWATAARDVLRASRPAVNTLVGPNVSTILDWAQVGLDAVVMLKDSGVFGDAGNRPIGMKLNTATNLYEYKPKTVRLNYDTAAKAVATNGGLITLPAFEDDAKLRGRYSLTLKVTRLDPPPAPAPTPTPTPDEPVEEPIESPLCRYKPWLCG
jgi:hypothetical protein